MSWELSEEHEAFRTVVRDFAEKEIRPHAADWDREERFPLEAVASMGEQVFGGAGFMEQTSVARMYRDAKILEIGEGTSEIQRLVLARHLGLPVS